MNDFPPDMNRDDLDEQIRAALQVEASPQQLARLETIWRRRSRVQRRRRTIAVASALAALILAAATVSFHVVRREWSRRPVVLDVPRQARPTTPEESPKPAEEVEPAPSPPAARAPTTYERFVFVARSPKTVGRPSPAATVAGLLDRLALEPETDVESLVQTAGLNRPAIERELLRRLARSNMDEAHAVLQLLGACGTSRSMPLLVRLAERAEFRDESLKVVERIAGAMGLVELASSSPDPRVRARIYRRLLTADETTLDVYLRLVHDNAMRREMLAMGHEVSEPVLTRLLQRLEDEDKSVRLAAALVLGEVNGPTVTRELIARVTGPERGVGYRETWIALVNCRGEKALSFLAFAAGQPRLIGPFRRARNWSLVNLPSWEG